MKLEESDIENSKENLDSTKDKYQKRINQLEQNRIENEILYHRKFKRPEKVITQF